MGRRVSLALALAALGCGDRAPVEAPAETLAPNLVLVIGDDHGYTDFGFMGSEVVQTPRLDRLAEQGVVFPVGYSTASLCRPALRTLLTGLDPMQVALRELEAPKRDAAALMRSMETLPRLLAERGYTSFQAGKYLEGHFEASGFSEGMVEHPGNRGLKQASRLVRETLDPALEFVTRNADRPFFLWFAPLLPHVPHEPPERFLSLYSDEAVSSGARRYYASVSWFDEAVGQLVDHIDGLGLGRRTLLVYLVDNGWDARPAANAEHALLGGPQGKKTLYELGLRTPILLRFLDALEAGSVRDELVSIADLFPTLLDYAGVAPPSDHSGHSLRPLLEGRAAWPRTALIGSTHIVRTDGPGRRQGGFFWRDPRWHYLEPAQRESELYDLAVDPRESVNVAKQNPQVVGRARAEIREWSRELAARSRPVGHTAKAAAPTLVPAPPEHFASPPPVKGAQAFDVVATDVDLDGDSDLLVNWHHHGPLELLENRDGRFAAFEAHDHVGLGPELYAESETMATQIRERDEPGLYLWHDRDRGGRWRLLWWNPAGARALAIELETSLEFLPTEGLEDAEREATGARSLAIRLDPRVRARAFSLQTRRIAVRLGIRRDPETPLFVGPNFAPAPDAVTELWKADPHGVAWLDLQDSPHPELFVSRGSLGGKLAPPAAAKRDGLWLPVPGGSASYALGAGMIPADYGRARRVEAVDVDADGRVELWVGSRASPNRLLAREAGGQRFTDRAGELGLDQQDGAVGTWGDFDGDGWQDLFSIEEGAFVLLRNDRQGGFERVAGDTIGVSLPSVPARKGLFDGARLRLADLDRDGDLDLLLLSHGARNAARIFRREGERFEDTTGELGVGQAKGGRVALVLDLDRDGYPDIVHLGGAPAIWHNRAGVRFDPIPLPASAVPRGLSAATALDANGDGAPDIFAVGRVRRLLVNQTETPNRSLEVTLPAAAIGALVTAHYADGAALAMRFGSEHSTAYSQALQPLQFGIPKGEHIERVTVRWPGNREAKSYAVRGSERLAIEAPP